VPFRFDNGGSTKHSKPNKRKDSHFFDPTPRAADNIPHEYIGTSQYYNKSHQNHSHNLVKILDQIP
jgi:hypothetical protein